MTSHVVFAPSRVHTQAEKLLNAPSPWRPGGRQGV